MPTWTNTAEYVAVDSRGAICYQINLEKMKITSTLDKLHHEGDSVEYRTLIHVIFAIDTTTDNGDIHPKSFCHSCYLTMLNIIEKPSYQSYYVKVFQFSSHPTNGSCCDICKKLTKGSRPKKVKRG